MGPDVLTGLEARLSAWAPKPSDDTANVVAILDPSWKEQASSVLLSTAAAPLSPPLAEAELVVEAQQLLLALGFNVGTPDGRLGSRTLAALRQFQQQSGLEVTGEITPEVLNAMRERAG
jgi:localization factor PodJL